MQLLVVFPKEENLDQDPTASPPETAWKKDGAS